MPLENTDEIEKKIETVLEHIRPYLHIDGGDVQLIKVTPDGIAEFKFLGSCENCALRPMTLRAGIERAIMHNVPEIKRIEAITSSGIA
jgi:Fe-S cluster biogenesis protein NfuA